MKFASTRPCDHPPRARDAALSGFALVACGDALAIDSLKILVPAAPGGGWDQTGRALQAALQSDGIVKKITVDNKGGAGGTIGIAQFVSSSKGDPNALMMGGMVMVGAIITNKSPVNLSQVTPIARLTGEYEVVVVPGTSKIQSLKELVAQFKANPGSVAWGGGSAGGTDHILAGMIAQASGVEPAKVNYIAYAGGGEAQAAIMGGHVAAGISGYGEFAAQIKSGKLRALGISVRQARARHRHSDAEGTGRRRRDGQLARRLRRAGHQRRAEEGADRRRRQGGEDGILAGHAEAQRLDRHVPRRRSRSRRSSTPTRSASTRSSPGSA